MTALRTHNLQEIPLIAQIYEDEKHLASEFIKDLDFDSDWVKAAISDRVADIINSGHVGQDMADKVDHN